MIPPRAVLIMMASSFMERRKQDDICGFGVPALKRVGVAEPDIVRLSELIAFVNYQIRVVQGIRLIGRLA